MGEPPVTLLADLVGTSQRVGATSARLRKVRELAGFLRALPPEEIETAVQYLSGETSQGRIGIGYSALQAAASKTAAGAGTLSIGEVDHSLAVLAGIRGAGSAAHRAAALRDLFSRATPAEQAFLLRLLVGELRQGALVGVMIHAIAAGPALPGTQVPRAGMRWKRPCTGCRVALLAGAL